MSPWEVFDKLMAGLGCLLVLGLTVWLVQDYRRFRAARRLEQLVTVRRPDAPAPGDDLGDILREQFRDIDAELEQILKEAAGD